MSYLHPPVRILFVLASEHVLGFDTYGVSLVPYVLASSSPRCPHRSKRPNRPRAFRVFFWSLQHQFVLWGDGGEKGWRTETEIIQVQGVGVG